MKRKANDTACGESFAGVGSVSVPDCGSAGSVNGIWGVQAGENRRYGIDFVTDVQIPAGAVNISVSGTPGAFRLYDPNGAVLCSSGGSYSCALTEWKTQQGCDTKHLTLECLESGSGTIAFEYFAVYEEKSYHAVRRVSFTAYETILEPISGERDGGYVINPAGMPSDESARFRCRTNPEIDGNRIKWAVKTGNANIANPVGNQVSASGNGAFELEVEIEGIALKKKPKVSSTGFQKTTTPVTVWVVRDDYGNNPAISETDVNALFPEVNKIFHQAGMSFSLSGSIRYTNRTDLLEIYTTNNFSNAALDTLLNLPPNVQDGVEICFAQRLWSIDTSDNSKTGMGGLNTTNGIVLGRDSNGQPPSARTMAHELGHACGLKDIYEERGNVVLSGSVDISPVTCPSDFGMYEHWRKQWNLVFSLLMYGEMLDNLVSIPRGSVWGVGRRPDRTYELGLINVGVGGMTTRSPKHQ